MKNIPEKIYLQIGNECDSEDFNELSEVSWCKDKIYDNDIEFTLQNKVSDPTTPESTANWSKIEDKDKWLDEVRGRENNVSVDTKIEEDLIYRIVENWGNAVHPISEMCKWLKEYASIVNERKDSAGVNGQQFCFEDIKDALKLGVNIGIKNTQEPRFEGEYRFDVNKAIQDCKDYIQALPVQNPPKEPGFQERVYKWLLACFGEEISNDKIERNHRFLEESLELVQSLGCTKSEVQQLVEYTFNRPIGDPKQEVGGVIVTLAALCSANKINLEECGETELSRIWTKVEKIREKQANKPKHSPLPESQQKEESEKELEERTDRNMNVISDFCEHLESEVGLVIPESAILSFFNA